MDGVKNQCRVIAQCLRRLSVKILNSAADVWKVRVSICTEQVLIERSRYVISQAIERFLLLSLSADIGLRADQANWLSLGISFNDLTAI